jgi:probable rRNA maturation factor
LIDIALINEGWPESIDWQVLAKRSADLAIAKSAHADLATLAECVEIVVRLTSDEEVQALNKAYRGKDKPTNVLSFPMMEPDAIDGHPGELMLGDIVLAQGVCVAEAAERSISVEAHATHLIVHGVLHLLGYDHIEEADAEEMEAIERRVMRDLGLHDPYED